ncbi:MAG: DUF4062 domain-containing protein, partial [Tagaea sp.]
MDIIHKVFVSSTYEDLREERAAVQKTLIELKCFPVGMEIFPAASEPAWDFIKRQIDDSDFYILIVGSCPLAWCSWCCSPSLCGQGWP